MNRCREIKGDGIPSDLKNNHRFLVSEMISRISDNLIRTIGH